MSTHEQPDRKVMSREPVELLRRRVAFLLALHGERLGTGAFVAFARRAAGEGRGRWREDLWPLPEARDATQLVGKALELGRTGARADVYVSALAFGEARRGNDLALPARVAWVDCDQPEAVERLRRFPLQPQIVVRSGRPGGGVHAYWLLEEPLEPARVGELNRRLAAHLGADPQACDPARVLRVPYTRNFKHPGRPLVELAVLRDRAARHRLGALEDSLPAVRRAAAAPARRATASLPAGFGGATVELKTALKAIDPAVYVPALVGEQLGRGGYVRCPFPHPHSPTGRDENPSLKVHPDGWHCYGCGRGGDIIALEGELSGAGATPTGRDFTQVVQRLAARFGVPASTRPPFRERAANAAPPTPAGPAPPEAGDQLEPAAPDDEAEGAEMSGELPQEPAGEGSSTLRGRAARLLPLAAGGRGALAGGGGGTIALPGLGPAAWAALWALLLTLLALFAFMVLLAAVLGNLSGSQTTCAPAPATGGDSGVIPARLVPLYTGAARRYRLGAPGWAWLAAINKVETDFGRNLSTSTAGAIGWMQFMPATWHRYGIDADGDGRADPASPADAIYSAARYLHASGAPGDWGSAVFAYNHAGWYVAQVTALARGYAANPQASVAAGAGTQVAAACAVPVASVEGDPDARALLANPAVTLADPAQRLDLLDGRVSPRLIALLSAIATTHRITITALASDHKPGTNHEAGRAADISTVDGERCAARAHGRAGRCYALARELYAMRGCLKPTELIYYWIAYPSRATYGPATLAEHTDHVHAGYDGPLGPKHYPLGTPPCSAAAINGAGG